MAFSSVFSLPGLFLSAVLDRVPSYLPWPYALVPLLASNTRHRRRGRCDRPRHARLGMSRFNGEYSIRDCSLWAYLLSIRRCIVWATGLEGTKSISLSTATLASKRFAFCFHDLSSSSSILKGKASRRVGSSVCSRLDNVRSVSFHEARASDDEIAVPAPTCRESNC